MLPARVVPREWFGRTAVRRSGSSWSSATGCAPRSARSTRPTIPRRRSRRIP